MPPQRSWPMTTISGTSSWVTREFERRRNAVTPAIGFERRDEVGDVAHHEYFARVGIENDGGIGTAVGAGNDDRTRRLAFGELLPLLAGPLRTASPRNRR